MVSSSDVYQMNFKPGGPTLHRFMRSDARWRGVMGPIGSGKTTTCLAEFIRRGFQQKPNPQGLRKTRWYVIRDTYRNVAKAVESFRKTVIRTGYGKLTGGNNEPAVWKQSGVRLPDGTGMDIEIIFAAVTAENMVAFFDGLEPTGIFINGADALPREAMTLAKGRLGRYPDLAQDGGPTWAGLWFDFNAPDYDSWAYEDWFENKPDGLEIFVQPGGLDENAENLHNLPGGREYYLNAAQGAPEWYVRRMVDNQFGYSRAGKPVYPEFAFERHVSPGPLKVFSGETIIVGVDAGRTPSAIFLQRDSHWQVRVLRELVAEDMDAKSFGRLVSKFIAEQFPGHTEFRVVGDPSALNKNDTTENDDDAWLHVFAKALKMRVRPAKSNKPSIRQGAVREGLTRHGPDGRPGLVVDPSCKTIIRGFTSGYRFKKRPAGAPTDFEDKPEKNSYSHPHDGLQYGAMEISDVEELGLRTKARSTQAAAAMRAASERWHPHSFLTGAR